jgi:hypothetical protein
VKAPETSRRRERPYVHFMQDGHCGDIKIGRSIDPERRLWNLHRAFALCRVGGEWFSPVAPLIDFINGLFANSCDVTKMLRERHGANVRCAGPCDD